MHPHNTHTRERERERERNILDIDHATREAQINVYKM